MEGSVLRNGGSNSQLRRQTEFSLLTSTLSFKKKEKKKKEEKEKIKTAQINFLEKTVWTKLVSDPHLLSKLP